MGRIHLARDVTSLPQIIHIIPAKHKTALQQQQKKAPLVKSLLSTMNLPFPFSDHLQHNAGQIQISTEHSDIPSQTRRISSCHSLSNELY